MLALLEQFASATGPDHPDYTPLRTVLARVRPVVEQIAAICEQSKADERGRILLDEAKEVPSPWPYSKTLLLSVDAVEVIICESSCFSLLTFMHTHQCTNAFHLYAYAHTYVHPLM